MYNAKYIIPGIILFVVIFTLPFWMNIFTPKYNYPELAKPVGPNGEVLECVEPAEWMRANHMDLLIEWRDSALRDEKRIYVSSTGREWETSLQKTCMECHTDYNKFCDTCHVQNAVEPYCWDCHIKPQGNN